MSDPAVEAAAKAHANVTDAVRASGGCGAISPDGEQACVLESNHGPHGWDASADGARQTQACDLRAELIEAVATVQVELVPQWCIRDVLTTETIAAIADAVLARLDQLGVHREQDGQ